MDSALRMASFADDITLSAGNARTYRRARKSLALRRIKGVRFVSNAG